MRRRGRGGRRAVARTPTPIEQESDQEMMDADESRIQTPLEDDADAQDSDAQPAASDPPSPPVVQQFPRKKRLGRPPKNRPPDWNSEVEANSESGTPQKRRRGRPSMGPRGRGSRGGPSHSTRVPIDKEGNMMDVVDDEVALPEDPEGEEKVDKMGNLQGGRDYRVRVFTITGRGERLYMLSTEPARCIGFRDSYLFFTKHMQLYKIIIDDHEKHDLIARDVIPHSYKGRAIGVVTARSVFREFGAKIVIGGKKVIDDYYASAARERGDVEGELAEPNDRLPAPGEPYNKNQYVAWHGASAVYHTGAPSVPLQNGKPVPGKRKVNITSANWMFEHARSSSRFNSKLVADRQANLAGTYDPHTNMMHFPRSTQPTHAKWEEVLSEDTRSAVAHDRPLLTNGVSATIDATNSVGLEGSNTNTVFSSVPPVVSRNFLITDTYSQSAALPNLGIPGPEGDYYDVGANGLSSIPDNILEDLPAECRQAFEEVRRVEQEWKTGWGTESQHGARATLKIGFSGVPV